MRRLFVFLLVVGGALGTVDLHNGLSAPGGGTCAVAPVLRDSAVNQGVSGTAGYSPLVRGKDTVVRLYLSGPNCGTQTFQLTSALLQVKNGSANLGSQITADPAPLNLNGRFPAISTYSAAAVANDTPGDAKFLVPGYVLTPSATTSFTATFAATIGWVSSGGTTGTSTFNVTAPVDQKTNALRILVVKMGDLSGTAYTNGFPLFGADAQTTVQNALSGTLPRAFPVPSANAAGSAPTGSLTSGGGGIRYSFNIDARCGGLSPTCGMIDLHALVDANGNPLLSSTRPFCLNGTTFAIVQPQLTNMLNAWNAANPGAIADRVVGVVDGSVSDQTCALGMAGFGTPEAVLRIDPGRNNNGATLVMEMAHTLGAVPKSRSSISSLYHSPGSEADTGSNTADPNSGTNRAYNLSSRTYLPTDRTAMRVVDSNWTDDNVDFEAKDFSLLRCALGGAIDTNAGCGTTGTTGSGVGVAADNVYVSGSLPSPTANVADVTESYVKIGGGGAPLTDGTANTDNYFLVERAGATVVKNPLPVSCDQDQDLHDATGAEASTSTCYFSGNLPFNGSADQIEIWRGEPSGVCTAPGSPAGCLYVRKKSAAPTTTVTTGGGGGTGVGVQTTWIHDTLHNGSLQDASTDNALFGVTHPDGAGNVYAAGYVTDCFNTQALTGCSKDIAVQKISPTGTVLWTSHGTADGQPIAGDPADDIATGIALGPNGVYVTGIRQGTCNGISDPGTLARCPAGGKAAFVAGLNTDNGGNIFLKLIDGPGKDVGNAIAYGDGNNLLYVAGGAEGTGTVNNTDATPIAGRLWVLAPSDGTIVPTDTGQFPADQRSSGAVSSWTGITTTSSSGRDDIWLSGNQVRAVAIHYADVSGTLSPSDWITNFGSSDPNCQVTQDHSSNSNNASTITFDNQSGVPVKIYWLNYNGNLEGYPNGFANDVLPAGQSYGQSTFITHPWVAMTLEGQCIGYTLSDAASKTYTIQAPQAASETTGGIAHAGSSVYVTGHTTGTIEEGQTGSGFVSALDDGGDGTQWTRQFGANQDSGEAVVANNVGVYVAGSAANAIGNAQNHGDFDAFLTHYDPNGSFLYATEFPTDKYDRGHGVSVDNETGDIFVAGETQGKIDFDPGAGGRNGFVVRFTEVTQDNTGGTATVSSSWPTAADATNARLDVYYHCTDPTGGELSFINYPVALAVQPTVNGSTAVFTVPNDASFGCSGGTMQFFENNGFSRFDVTPSTPITLTAPPNTAPVAAISEPKPETHWLQYQTIPAFGSATDAKDGDFHGPALHWSLTGPSGTTTATGDTPTFGGPPNGLTPGAYTLVLGVTDSGGLNGSATVHFTVDPDANNDWIPGTVSCISDTAPGVAFGDADNDHIPNIDDARPCTPDTLPDTTRPTITVTHVTGTNTNNTNDTITFTVKASDAGSGLRSVFCTVDGNPANGLKDATWAAATFTDTFTETASGAHAVVCTATDLDYNSATATDNVYNFVGFLQPIDNPPTVNTGSAGKTYPVKFKLVSPTGTSLGDASLIKDVRFKSVTCGSFSSDPMDAIETVATGGTSLRFDGSQWTYNWATPSAKGCYVLYVLLSDGSTRQANFQLK
jgi:hypothetical protein